MRGFEVIKNLVVDMNAFFAKCRAVKPCPISDEMLSGTERLQTLEERGCLDATARCILGDAYTTGCCSF